MFLFNELDPSFSRYFSKYLEANLNQAPLVLIGLSVRFMVTDVMHRGFSSSDFFCLVCCTKLEVISAIVRQVAGREVW